MCNFRWDVAAKVDVSTAGCSSKSKEVCHGAKHQVCIGQTDNSTSAATNAKLPEHRTETTGFGPHVQVKIQNKACGILCMYIMYVINRIANVPFRSKVAYFAVHRCNRFENMCIKCLHVVKNEGFYITQ